MVNVKFYDFKEIYTDEEIKKVLNFVDKNKVIFNNVIVFKSFRTFKNYVENKIKVKLDCYIVNNKKYLFYREKFINSLILFDGIETFYIAEKNKDFKRAILKVNPLSCKKCGSLLESDEYSFLNGFEYYGYFCLKCYKILMEC